MSDCANVEVRELLPELMHGRLGEADRARVQAHVAGCEECAAELATLQAVQRAYSHVPAIDTAAVVRALPRPARPTVVRRAPRVAWRIAAAVSFISLGGISLVVARSFFDMNGAGISSTAGVDSGARTGDTSVVPQSPGTVTKQGSPMISFGGGVADLKTEDLEKLLKEIDALEAAPPAEPESVPASEAGTGRVRSDTSGGVQ
jgi:putative zinc finger protein